ncbi:16S rRNA (guanine(527)-N(7))-methyltransferase RsmG [Ramlibacter sp.]|uniref:16S rRNA (guanine(527)-N(7))-methyltransferase RsmG n=1 Tax=Ramlibacter sp. TaxID=1917967 RepID=UPI0017EA2D18|nr:16S rRNA (guanine(527)-N(7))-methyltransferase RsmG [Ramlibacter sp.]MBA2674710.1 16S rRNA (guanine(527)-N(7))-methyltransferase RsmG [Ramlibacter sp.]
MSLEAGPAALEPLLRNGIEQLGLALSGIQIAQLLDYLDLIQHWNKVYNLTAVRDPREMVTQHLLDSLSIVLPLQRQAPTEQGARLLDVGSGAGLPGVVLAVCCPELKVECVDAVAKKVAFIQNAAAQLRLPNLQGRHARVETLTAPYDVVCSRAFASLADFVVLTSSALAEGGIWLAMKGKRPDAEIATLPATVDVFHVEQLQVPSLDAERCIVWMRKTAAERQ